MTVGPWVAMLYVVAGLCLYAGLLHARMGLRRPRMRSHLSFAAVALLVGGYVMASAGTYSAETPESLIDWRRAELTFAIALFGLLPTFVDHYFERDRHWAPIAIAVLAAVVLVANLGSPYSLSFVEPPVIRSEALPFGGLGTDVREHRVGGWHHVMWLGFFLSLSYGITMAALEAKRQPRRAIVLGLAYAVFLVSVTLTLLSVQRVIAIPHVGEFGFLALVLLMGQALTVEFARGERRMRRLLDEVPAIVYLKDRAGRFIWINSRIEPLIGRPAASLLGLTDHDVFSSDEADRIRANDRRVLELREACRYEESVTSPGGRRTYSSLKFPVMDADGTAVALGGVSVDIEDQKRVEQELKGLRDQAWYADRVARLGMLNSSIAHELNQPLAAILFNSKAGLRMLAQNALDAEETQKILEEVARDSKRAGAIISGMRSMVRRQQTPRLPIDAGAMVEEVLALLQSELALWSVSVRKDFAADCTVMVDKAQIQQVIINLLMNALEAMRQLPADLAVSVVRASNDSIRIAIEDSGEGIPDSTFEKLFDAFNTSKADGLGIGLSICRSIVEAHGGSIRAERNAGRGMTFSFTLPCSPGDGAHPAALNG